MNIKLNHHNIIEFSTESILKELDSAYNQYDSFSLKSQENASLDAVRNIGDVLLSSVGAIRNYFFRIALSIQKLQNKNQIEDAKKEAVKDGKILFVVRRRGTTKNISIDIQEIKRIFKFKEGKILRYLSYKDIESIIKNRTKRIGDIFNESLEVIYKKNDKESQKNISIIKHLAETNANEIESLKNFLYIKATNETIANEIGKYGENLSKQVLGLHKTVDSNNMVYDVLKESIIKEKPLR